MTKEMDTATRVQILGLVVCVPFQTLIPSVIEPAMNKQLKTLWFRACSSLELFNKLININETNLITTV